MSDVTTLGEALLRLSVPTGIRIAQTDAFAADLAGAELNVTAALAAIGRDASWFGALPKNPLGAWTARRLRELGVDTAGIRWVEGGRLGIYFVELAQPPRPVQVTYDRKGSAATGMQLDNDAWKRLLDTRILHLTGITPALSDVCRHLVEHAIARARASGIPVSFDVNYRASLWSSAEAAEWVARHAQGLELVFCAERDARLLFGLDGAYREVAERLWNLLKPTGLVLTRADRGSLHYDGETFTEQPAVPVEVLDRLGAGDAFAGGVLDGWLDGSATEGMRRGAVLAGLALAQRGDQVVTDRGELEHLMTAIGGTGSIQR